MAKLLDRYRLLEKTARSLQVQAVRGSTTSEHVRDARRATDAAWNLLRRLGHSSQLPRVSVVSSGDQFASATPSADADVSAPLTVARQPAA